MISRQPVRLYGAGQRFVARCVGYVEMSRVEAASGSDGALFAELLCQKEFSSLRLSFSCRYLTFCDDTDPVCDDTA